MSPCLRLEIPSWGSRVKNLPAWRNLQWWLKETMIRRACLVLRHCRWLKIMASCLRLGKIESYLVLAKAVNTWSSKSQLSWLKALRLGALKVIVLVDSHRVTGRNQFSFSGPRLLEFLSDLSLWLDWLVCHSHALYTQAKHPASRIRCWKGLYNAEEHLGIWKTWNFCRRGSLWIELPE